MKQPDETYFENIKKSKLETNIRFRKGQRDTMVRTADLRDLMSVVLYQHQQIKSLENKLQALARSKREMA